jgi:hypothetical protein
MPANTLGEPSSKARLRTIQVKRQKMHLEHVMGIGMQVVFLGFPGSFVLQAAASVQLVRLERFGRKISGCNLTLRALTTCPGLLSYEARLDLIALNGPLLAMAKCASDDPLRAVEAAFDAAETELARDATTCG